MAKTAILAMTIAVVASLASARLPSYGFYKAPKFTLDLDKAPENRWDGAVDLVVNAYGWDNSIGAILNMYQPQMDAAPAILVALVDAVLAANYPTHYAELSGIAKQMQAAAAANGFNTTVLTQGHLAMWVFFYEFADLVASVGGPAALEAAVHAHAELIEERGLWPHMKRTLMTLRQSAPRRAPRALPPWKRQCTGILSLPANRSAATIHGRNMDESPEQGRNTTLDITVTQGGVEQYRMFDWMWMTTGVYTGSRRGHQTLEFNWRHHSELSAIQVIGRLLDNATMPVQFLFRTIFERAMSYEESITFINTTQFATNFYCISAGTERRGAIYTISYNSSDNVVVLLSDNSTLPYMVQTNYDRWLPDPMSDPRRTVAEQHLALIGPARAGTELGVWMVAGVYPVHNENTMYTALMSVDTDLEAYIREPMTPQGGMHP
jgi:N-acylethanolamine-hydrolysing acid amidase